MTGDPHAADADAWFWSEGHQAAEREVDADLAAGRYQEFANAEEFLAYLERVSERAGD